MYGVVLMAAMTAGSASPDCCFSQWRSHGCNGGCYGGCNGGCYGGGYGGCYGGCYGGGCYGGGYGGGYSCYGAYGCYGCYGGWSCYGSGYSCYGSNGYSPYHQMVPMDPKGEKLPLPKTDKDAKDDTSRAKVIIDVPAEAKLYIDDKLMPTKAGKRTFVTPALKPGSYYYDVKLVLVRDGQVQTETTRVVLRPGEVVAASFPGLQNGAGTAVAQSKEE
jgi:uncharacterized protein (TIGR03000 family)